MRPAANDLFQEEPISQADLKAAQRRNSLWEALQASSETHAHITIETDTLHPLEISVAATLVNLSIVPDAVLEVLTPRSWASNSAKIAGHPQPLGSDHVPAAVPLQRAHPGRAEQPKEPADVSSISVKYEHTHVDGPEQHTRLVWVSQEALKPIVVRPRSHAYLGPILFRPRLRRRISAKNNLTFVDSITLQGTGGSAELKFSEPRYGASPAPIEQLVFDITTVQLIACNLTEIVLTKPVFVTNVGDLPLTRIKSGAFAAPHLSLQGSAFPDPGDPSSGLLTFPDVFLEGGEFRISISSS